MKLESVADIVKAHAVSDLAVCQADHVAPLTVGSGHRIKTSLSSQFGDQMRRNDVADLSRTVNLSAAGSSCGFLFTPLSIDKFSHGIPVFSLQFCRMASILFMTNILKYSNWLLIATSQYSLIIDVSKKSLIVVHVPVSRCFF